MNTTVADAAVTVAQAPTPSLDLNSVAQALPSANSSSAIGATIDSAPESDAEQVTRIKRTISADEQRVADLRRDLADPASEYHKAEAEFKTIDERYSAAKSAFVQLQEKGDTPLLLSAESEMTQLEETWKLAKERFDLAIQTRKTLQEQVAALEAKGLQDRQALNKLTGATQPSASAPSAEAAETPKTAAAPSPASSAVPTAVADTAAPTVSASNAAGPTPEPTLAGAPNSPSDLQRPLRPELVQAQQEAAATERAAQAALSDARSVSERLAALETNLEIEQKLLVAAQKKSDLANSKRRSLGQEYQKKVAEGSAHDELQAVSDNITTSEEMFQNAREEVRLRTDRLTELHLERAHLQREALAAQTTAQAKQDELVKAQERVGQLKNPFSPQNLMQWVLDHTPRLILVLAVMLALHRLVHAATRRVVSLMVQRGSRDSQEENEDRAKTLVGVFHNAASLTIFVGGALMICEEVGVAVGPLMGGAAVLGLSVAFGAQNLIRDYFYGFVILLENQYKINDVLKIGDVSGQVERITLRMTVLRDLGGSVHFIPNGKIDCVTNMTHGWSRAVFEIGVAYHEDVDRVMAVLLELGREMRRDPAYARLIIDEPEMLGLDDLADSAVVIKFVVKTRPMQQWTVKRELLRRIKRRFDELHIEIPFPQRTLHVRDNRVSDIVDSGASLSGLQKKSA